jgi:hypothetical protein
MRRPRARTIVIASAAAFALLVGGTAAYAATTGSPIDNNGVIHACYGKETTAGSFSVQLQDAGMTCPSKTTAIMWNQQGPQGLQGQQGLQGPAGPSTAGPNGLDVEYVFATGTSGFAVSVANCPADHPWVLGGGGFTLDGTALNESFPSQAPLHGVTEENSAPFVNGWQVTAANGGQVDSFAICAK